MSPDMDIIVKVHQLFFRTFFFFPRIQAALILLCFADTVFFVFVFTEVKVCGNPASSKSVGIIL